VRSAAVKFANRAELPTLSDKLDSLFKQKLTPLCGKNKAKSVEEEVNRSYLKLIEKLQKGRGHFRRAERSSQSDIPVLL